jgi:hypothetical protein
MNDEKMDLIRELLRRYVTASTPDKSGYRILAEKYQLLPVLPDWSGFVGLREDGVLLWVSQEDGTVSMVIKDYWRHLAMIRGSDLFPELSFLRPVVSPTWVTCSYCGGSGKVVFEGLELSNVACFCGGMGKLPPNLAHLQDKK